MADGQSGFFFVSVFFVTFFQKKVRLTTNSVIQQSLINFIKFRVSL